MFLAPQSSLRRYLCCCIRHVGSLSCLPSQYHHPSQPFFVVLPDSWLRRVWEAYMLAPMLYVAFITPFRIFFNEEATVR